MSLVVLPQPGHGHPAFLRFLAAHGVVPAGIEGAVPTIREWKHARLPRALADDDVQRALAAVDETRPNAVVTAPSCCC